MRRYSLHTLVLSLFLFLILISLFSIYFSVIKFHKEQLLKTAVEEKIHLAKTINETVASPVWLFGMAEAPGFEKAFITEMAQFKDVQYIRILGLDGTILQSSLEEEEGKTIKDPDIEKAIITKTTIVKDEIFKGEKLKTIIYPGYEDKIVWITFALEGLETFIKKILIRDIALALSMLTIALSAIFLVFQTLTGPIKKMITACQEVRRGNLSIKIPVTSKTEIGELAATFNEMIKDLKESHAALEESKSVLEIKVAARTRELKELTEKQEEIIKERTREIQERMAELERFQKVAVGRELKMIELKKEIKKLKEELGKRLNKIKKE